MINYHRILSRVHGERKGKGSRGKNAVEWRLFELHSMFQCRDIEQEIHLPMWAFDRGGV